MEILMHGNWSKNAFQNKYLYLTKKDYNRFYDNPKLPHDSRKMIKYFADRSTPEIIVYLFNTDA